VLQPLLRWLPLADGDLDDSLDLLQLALLLGGGKGDRSSCAADPAGAADAVDVDLGVVGHVVVDHVGDVLDVESARGDVGRDKERGLVLLERDHHAVALTLGEIAMQCLHPQPPVGQLLVETCRADLGAHEDDRLLGLFGTEHLHQPFELLARLDHHIGLLHRVDGELPGRNPDRDRVIHVLLGEPRDRLRYRRREEQRLAPTRAHPQNPLDVLDEAEVEHLIRLVEDDIARGGQDQRLPGDQVHHAAHRGDHDLRAGSQASLLVADRGPAKDRNHVDTLQMLGVRTERLRHLDTELPGRGQNDRLGLLVLRVDLLEHRQPEGCCLAAPGLCLADHVTAVEQLGDRLRLDRGRLDVAELVQRHQQPLGQT
jgi:hypothetical protein